jgi:mono/diheme cytochrome c family protein
MNKNPTASDLTEFGTKNWIKAILNTPDDDAHFGKTKLTEMSKWVKGQRAKAKGAKLAELEADFDEIAEWLATSPRKDPESLPEGDPFRKGYTKFDQYCAECHTYNDKTGEGGKGPDLAGYGDADWLRAMIMNPGNTLRYGKKNQMTAFRQLDGPGSELVRAQFELDKQKVSNLSDIERELIIRWMLKDYRVVFGGEIISGAAKK